MQKFIFILFLLLHSYAVFSQSNLNKDIADIKAVRNASNLFIAKHDVYGEVSFFTDDYIIISGSGASVTGKGAYISRYKDDTTSTYVRTPQKINISYRDTLAFETGDWVQFENSKQKNSGNYSAMWRKTSGIWKIRSELYVTLWLKN